MKNTILRGITALLLVANLAGGAHVFAATTTTPPPSPPTTTQAGAPSVRAEQTDWYYIIASGQEYKRLWSYTQGKWLTDWIPV